MFAGTREKCVGCNKTVYPIEKVTTIAYIYKGRIQEIAAFVIKLQMLVNNFSGNSRVFRISGYEF